MKYFLGIIFCILGILIFINRFFVKRRIKHEKIMNILFIVVFIVFLIINIINFIEFKENLEMPYTEELEIFEEKGSFYVFDKNGNVVRKNATIGEMLSNFFIKDVFDGTINISKNEYIKNNIIIVTISALLLVYWFVLLILYEKEEEYKYEQQDDIELLEKYNPMIAACISQNRNIMGRDIIAVILNLIEKGKINLRIVSDEKSSKVKYKYMISENKESRYQTDIIEEYIYDWLFENIKEFMKNKVKHRYISINDEGIIEIDLIKRIRSFSVDQDTYYRLQELKKISKTRLNKKGANNNSVPILLKIFNVLIIMGSILLLVGNHVVTNGIGIVINNLHVLIIMFSLIFLITILPLIYIITLVILKAIMISFKSLQEITEKNTGRNLLANSICIILATVILITIVLLLPIDTYIVYDVLIIGIGFLIIKTDDYMLKHDRVMLNDYYNLKRIEDKIANYSLMKEKNIEYIEIWDKYYSYSVALGIPLEVNKESIINYNLDSRLIINKTDMQAIYYVCKSYLEVMWDFEFNSNKSILNIINKLRKI